MHTGRATAGYLLACIAMTAAAAPPEGTLRQAPGPAVDPAHTVPSKQPAAVAPAPVIKALAVDGCVEPGASLVIHGARFAPRGKRQAVLFGDGAHVDLKIREWADGKLVTVIPDDPALVPGRRYRVGIEAAPHGPWQSNLDRSLVLCGEPPGAAATGAERVAVPAPRSGDEPPSQAADQGQDEPAADTATPPVDPFGSSAGASANYRSPNLLTPGTDREDPAADAEPGQLLVWHPDMAAARAFGEALGAEGYSLRGRVVLESLGVVQTVVGLPAGVSIAEAAGTLAQRFPDAVIDANHRYRPLEDDDWALTTVGWQVETAACGNDVTVGLVDTDIDTDHPRLAGQALVRRAMLPAGVAAAPTAHGTAVAGRLAELLPRARLRVAAAFRLRDGEITDTTAEWLLQALDWLAGEAVAAINLSLGGPANRLLALAVERLDERGIGLVAAVAEGGPDSTPAYPAAYDGVIGVTAVDARLRVFAQARRGPEVDLAAPGVDVRLPGTARYLTGTSHAAPFVTAALALAGNRGALTTAARDLGPPGRDDVFGAGLVRFDGLCGNR